MKLGLVASNPTSPSSFYRAFGVFPFLARDRDIELMIQDTWDWSKVVYCDVIYFHCPAFPEHAKLINLAAKCHVPVWIDYDDDMFHLERSNAGYSTIMRPEIHETIKHCIQAADMVTVSTECLSEEMCPSAEVIPNAFNDYLWQFNEQPRQKVIVWRGGPTHYPDLEAVLPALARVARRHPDWKFHFMGCVHWKVEKEMPDGSFEIHEWTDLLDYSTVLSWLRPALQIVPLEVNKFNKAKSNCAWIEATAAGARVLAPDWPEWRQPGIINFLDFESALESSLDLSGCGISREFIQKNLLLSSVNERRLEILTQLVKKGKQNHG